MDTLIHFWKWQQEESEEVNGFEYFLKFTLR